MDMLLQPQQLVAFGNLKACELKEFSLLSSSCPSSWTGRPVGRQRHLLRGALSWGVSKEPFGSIWCKGVEFVHLRGGRSTPSYWAAHAAAARTSTTSSYTVDKVEKMPTLVKMWERLQRSEGTVEEEDLVIHVPSVQERCGRAGGSLFSQRNAWMNQELLPMLSSAQGPQSEADNLPDPPTIRLGTVDVEGSDAAVVDRQTFVGRPTISSKELRRLQKIGLPLKHHFKIGRSGVTEGVVQIMRNVWRNSELVKIRCHGPAADNVREIVDDIEVTPHAAQNL